MQKTVLCLLTAVLAWFCAVGAHAAPISLRGSLEARAKENAVADRYGMLRYRDVAELWAAARGGELVRAQDVGAVRLVRKDIGERDRANAEAYLLTRPWVQRFLRELANDPTLPAGAVLNVTSLVRTEAYQRKLTRQYANAARGGGARRSSHLTGSTVDITTKGMPP